jgi:hypothetical protein
MDHSGLGEEDPCPVCGDLGTHLGHEKPGSRGGCVSRYR